MQFIAGLVTGFAGAIFIIAIYSICAVAAEVDQRMDRMINEFSDDTYYQRN